MRNTEQGDGREYGYKRAGGPVLQGKPVFETKANWQERASPRKPWDPASWKEGAANASAQSWRELRVFTGTKRSARWECGLKEQIEARGTDRQLPSWGNPQAWKGIWI